MKQILGLARAVFVALLAITPILAFAQGEAPDELVKRVTGEVLRILAEAPPGSPVDDATRERIRNAIVPQFDFTRMTALAVGAPWREASKSQRAELEAQFRELLKQTYAATITRNRIKEIEYKPLRRGNRDSRVVVSTVSKFFDAPSVTIDYRLEQTPSGWKVYDVIADGVSLVITYRNVFGQEVNQNGIDGLIRMLADKNAQLRGNGDSAG